MTSKPVVVLISANSEWRVVKHFYNPPLEDATPFGTWFMQMIEGRQCVFLHGGWGKISAAASAQYAIDRWQPEMMINLGTCGGLEGRAARGELLLVKETLVYDIIEQMSDPDEAIQAYAVDLDLCWLHPPFPVDVRQVRLISADRDILSEEVPLLIARFDAVAADWESGAIAWVANHSSVRCLILRGVSDLVSTAGGEAYGNHSVFTEGTNQVMTRLLASLPGWLACSH